MSTPQEETPEQDSRGDIIPEQETTETKHFNDILGNIIDKNIKQLTDVLSAIPVGSAIKILTLKGEKPDSIKVKTKIKGIITNLNGIIEYRTVNINDKL